MKKNLVMSVFLLVCPIWAYANILTITNTTDQNYTVLMIRGDREGSYTADLSPHSSIFYNNTDMGACAGPFNVRAYGMGKPSAVIYSDKAQTLEVASVSLYVSLDCSDGSDGIHGKYSATCDKSPSSSSNVTTNRSRNDTSWNSWQDCTVTIK